jgi:hypothetical protein
LRLYRITNVYYPWDRFDFTGIGGHLRKLFFALLAQWRCLRFDFTGTGGQKTAEARKRPEIESYNRCVLRIACAMALFAV